MTCSTSHVAKLIIHRNAMFGVLDEHGCPVKQTGMLETPGPRKPQVPLQI